MDNQKYTSIAAFLIVRPGVAAIEYMPSATIHDVLSDALQLAQSKSIIVTFQWSRWGTPIQVTVMRHSIFKTIYDRMLDAANGAHEPYVGP
jgi:hypothetical protein